MKGDIRGDRREEGGERRAERGVRVEGREEMGAGEGR